MKFKLVDALVLSTLIHTVGVMGIPNSCRFSKPQSKPFRIELVDADQDSSEPSDLAEGLEDFVEHIPDTGEVSSSIPASYLTRDHQYERILSGEMFPGLKYLDVPLPTERKPVTKLMVGTVGGGGGRENPLPRTPEDLQSTLDQLMPLPKEDQFDMVMGYVENNPDSKKDVAVLVGEFYRQNMVRVVYRYSDEQLVIDLFEEQLNKEQLFEYVYDYLESDPDSEVAVEFLFMLERTYANSQINIGTALTYDIEPNVQKDIKKEVANRINGALERRVDGLFGDEVERGTVFPRYALLSHLGERMTKKRIELLERVVAIGEYRRNDALFLLGKICYDDLDDEKKAGGYLKRIDPKEKDFVFRRYYDKARRGIENDNEYAIRPAFNQLDADQGNLIDERGKKFIWEKHNKKDKHKTKRKKRK